MSRIEKAFARAGAERRAAFIPYITAGDPDPAATPAIARALAEEGADVLEIGVPFSDPLADGPVIQRACERALGRGTTLRTVLDMAERIRSEVRSAIVLFTYVNPILAFGIQRFADRCAEAGIDGVLATDLPLEESGDLGGALARRGVHIIRLMAPTSGTRRIALLREGAGGFIYYISRTGVTGEHPDLPPDLPAQVEEVRRLTSLPVAVGFGISTPEQYRSVASIADGVVVGSAIVRAIEEAPGAPAEAARRVARRLQGRDA
jgi:tryptophan synthase alpha chain